MISEFTFHVTSGAVETELNPIIDDLVFREQEDGDLGLYVRELTTQLLFQGSDYEYFYDNWEVSGLCDELPFEIRYNGSAYYTGVLKLGSSNLSWDLDKCRVTARISPSGDYTCLEDNWEDEFNALDGYTKRSMNSEFSISFFTCTSSAVPYDPFEYVDSCLTSAEYWSVVEHRQTESIGGTYDRETKWAQERVTVSCSGGSPVAPPGDGWVLWQDNCPTDAVYARAPITELSSRDDSDILTFYEEINSIVGSEIPVIDNGVFLNDILDGENPCPGSVISDFFSLNGDDTYPSGDVYDEAKTNLSNVIVYQKSDVKRPDTSNNATVALTTYRELLEQLRTMFNVELRFTSGGDLRIEHVSYWNEEQGLDLTASTYAPYISGTKKYEYNEDDVPKREKWQFMEEATYGFTGKAIVYDCPGDNAQDQLVRTIERTNNDVAFVYDNETVSDDGFVFAAAYELSGSYYFMEHDSPLPEISERQLNGYMSIPNLLDKFHRHERPFPTGTLNSSQTTFESSVRRKAQVELRIKYSREDFRDLDASKLIKTGLGWGKVDEMEYSAKSCTLKLRLLYE